MVIDYYGMHRTQDTTVDAKDPLRRVSRIFFFFGGGVGEGAG